VAFKVVMFIMSKKHSKIALARFLEGSMLTLAENADFLTRLAQEDERE